MTIRWKILLFIFSLFILLNLGVYQISRHTLFRGYADVEERLAKEHLERVRGTLEDDLASLVRINVDWSAWDDSYEFIRQKNRDYLESNLVESTFEELELNAIVLLDASGRVVYSGSYDADEGMRLSLPDGLETHLGAQSPLMKHAGPEARIAGILSLPRGPFLVSSCPIIRSDMSGPVRGAFIMGRFLGEEQLQGVIDRTRLAITMLPPGDRAPEADDGQIRYSSAEQLQGTVPFDDLYGRPAFALEVVIPRDISLQGRATLNAFFRWNLVVTLLAAILIYLVVDRWLTNREVRIESEERFQLMFVHSEAGICSVSKDGRFREVNAAFSRTFGYDSTELVGQELTEMVSPIDRAWIASFFAFGRNSSGISGSFECRFIHHNGQTIWCKVSIGWVSSRIRSSCYAILMVQDLTARKRVEDQLKIAVKDAREAQAKARAIIRSANDGLMLVDGEMKIRMVNPATEQLLDLPAHEMTHRPLASVVDSECLEKMLGNIRSGACPGQSCDVEIPGLTASEHKHIRIHAAPVVDRKGRMDSIILTLHDRTRDTELEQMKNDFIMTAAHEIRTPLAAVMGFSELLLDEKGVNRQDRQTYIGYIYEKTMALDNIVNELLDLERISTGRKVELRLSRIEMNAFLARIVRQYETAWSEHKFFIDLPQEALALNLDGKKMEQVLSNLMTNAVKYSPVGGRVWVKGQLMAKEFRVCVEDQGVGMTADELEKVFEKFYRARATAELADGVGLGLTISKEIVEAHGGRIWLNSVYGEGTRVYISLPLPAPD